VLGDAGADAAGFLVVCPGCRAGFSSMEAAGAMTETSGDLAVETATAGVLGRHAVG
jgi:hypothetical protein